RAVPRIRPGHRLHRRRDDAVLVRPHADRGRHARKLGRDTARTAARGRCRRARVLAVAVCWASSGGDHQQRRANGCEQPTRRPGQCGGRPGQHLRDREPALHPLHLRFRGDQRPADHRRPWCDGARAPRTARTQARPARADARPVQDWYPPNAATRAWRVRAAQRGRHSCTAARRQSIRTQRATGYRRVASRTRAQPATGRARRPAIRDEAVMSPTYYLYLSAILFTIGSLGVLLRRNAIVVFMCVELMLNAGNLALVTFSRINGDLNGQIMAFFVMVVAAAEVVVGLAIIVSVYRTRRSASVDDASLLKY